jgi:hypothetical protein
MMRNEQKAVSFSSFLGVFFSRVLETGGGWN